MARRRYGSRLARKESKRMARQGVLFLVLAVVLVGVIIFWGVPAMVKMAGFFGEIRNTSLPIEDGDQIAPFAPRLSVDHEATFSAQIRVDGFAEAESTVVLYNNGEKVAEVVTNDEGEFGFSNVRLEMGENKLKALSKDSSDNESAMSRTEVVIFDLEPPKLSIESPGGEGSEVSSDKSQVVVAGQSEAGARVLVNGRVARVGSGGDYSITTSLNEGDNQIEVKAFDRAGNMASKSLKVVY